MIPIRNIYYMLAYAFQALTAAGYRELATEEFENTADLCAAILCKGTSKLIKQGLGREYVDRKEQLTAIKGKIDLSDSIKTRATMRNQLVCSYDDSLLRWMMRKPCVTLLRGNHEVCLVSMQNMFLNAKDGKLGDAFPGQLLPFTAWVNDDGANTFLALKKLCNEDPEEVRKIFDYLAKARLYLEVTAGGKNYVLVHSGLKNFSPERPLSDYKLHELIVARPGLEARYYEDKTVIFGHTPTERLGNKGRMVVTDTWIDIDTGAGHGGTPMLLRLDDLKAFYV